MSSFISLEFVRLTKIEFTQTQYYRTIEKYITQNYVKYPIYSDWKIKTKKISKSLKLTNSALEELNCHSDPLIKEFAFDIVISLNTDDLLPSWFIREYAKKESKEKTQKLRQELNQFTYEQEQEIRKIQKNISTATIAINEKAEIIKAIQTKKLKLEQKLNNINSAKKSIFLNIITFGIYYYYTSKTRKDKLEKKISVYQIDIDTLTYTSLKSACFAKSQNPPIFHCCLYCIAPR